MVRKTAPINNIPNLAYDDNGNGAILLTGSGGGGGGGVPAVTAAAPAGSGVSILAANTSRRSAIFYNNGTQVVYLGTNNNVSSANGFPLPIGGVFIDNLTGAAWFAIAASGTGDIRIIEVS